jgi:hypothetical protein
MTKTWRYSIPSQKYEGWAILFLDDAGCFAVLSDYGNYAYRWNANGFGNPGGIRPFLLECDDSYLMGKIAPEREYDGKKTLKNVKAYILETRRNRDMTKERADDEWVLLEVHNDLESEFDLQGWHDETKIQDAWDHDFAEYRFSDQAKAFFERAWPRLKACIQAELDAEAGGSAVPGQP